MTSHIKSEIIKDMTQHKCRVAECTTIISYKKLLCMRHWELVPLIEKLKLSDVFMTGFSIDDQPTLDWAGAVKDTLKTVQLLESQQQEKKRSTPRRKKQED